MRLGADFVKDNEMKAVHDDDLVQLLNSLGVYENIIHGDYTCLFCKKIITLDNIDSIVPFKQSVQFTCNSPECHHKLIGWEE